MDENIVNIQQYFHGTSLYRAQWTQYISKIYLMTVFVFVFFSVMVGNFSRFFSFFAELLGFPGNKIAKLQRPKIKERGEQEQESVFFLCIPQVANRLGT